MRDMSAPNLNQQRVRQSFRRGLATYHSQAVAQAGIARDLAALLAESGAPAHFETAMEFGCGTGLLTGQLLGRFGIGQLTLNDLVPEAAPGLGVLTSQRSARTQFTFGPVETVPLPRELELIASASTVQWIEDIPSLMARLVGRLSPGGWLALSGFGRAHFHELQALGSSAAAPSYADAAEWPAMLPAGMEIIATRQRGIRLAFPSALELLRHLRRTGVNAQAGGRWSRARLAAFEAEYRSRFGQDGSLPLTYDPVWIIARKTG